MHNFPKILLVDMNSFFASVEQQANPFWRGKPLGVCASLHETSCLIAASKEAKALGITTGMLVYKAKRIYPKIILLQAEPEKYREVNRRINQIFRDYTDQVEEYSIDESFLELNSNIEYRNPKQYLNSKHKYQNHGFENLNFEHSNLFSASDLGFRILPNHLLVAAEIKKRIRHEVGEWLTCSVGIGQNKFLAKLAADMEKPDGLTIIWRENLPEIYKSKQLKDLWGIGRGWEGRLGKLGITSPAQILDYPVQNLISLFGKPGYDLWQRVNGLERDEIGSSLTFDGSAARIGKRLEAALPDDAAELRYASRRRITSYDEPKSFGHSWVLNFRTTDKEKLKPVILRLAEKAARRMRRQGFVANAIYLSVRLVNGESKHQSKKLKFSLETGQELYEQALILWRNWKFNADVMHIAVGFTNLAPRANQLELFDTKIKKSQITNNKSQISTNNQNIKFQRAPFGASNLDLGIYLDFGACDLELSNPRRLTHTIDLINDKYGEFTIRSGLLTKTSDYAPDSIAFGR